MKDNAGRVIPNPARKMSGSAEYTKYTPQYRIMGIEPEEVNFNNNAPDAAIRLIKEEEMNLDNPRQKNKKMFASEDLLEEDPNVIPNVGNNVEQTWNEPLIDKKSDHSIDDQYILVANQEIIKVGSLSTIEDEIRSVFYDEHEICKQGITVDDLVVLKKLKIKIGIFVE